MAEQYRTPSTSVAPSIENLKAEPVETGSPGIQMSLLRGQSTTYPKMRQNERSAIKNHIDKEMAKPHNKLEVAAAEHKLGILKKWMADKIKDRERKGNGSMRLCFPEDYDEDEEDDWLKYAFRVTLDPPPAHQAQHDWDRDDEEPIPIPQKIKSEIKDEYEDNNEADDWVHIPRNPKIKNVSTHFEDDEEPSKPECWPCSRGLSISIGGAAFSNVQVNADVKPDFEVGPATVKMEVDGDAAVEVNVLRRGVVRSWKWVGGRMVVWPPFDNGEGVKAS